MKNLSWPVVVLAIAVLAALVFLVHDGKVQADVLVGLISTVVGGGLIHAGRTSGGGDEK